MIEPNLDLVLNSAEPRPSTLRCSWRRPAGVGSLPGRVLALAHQVFTTAIFSVLILGRHLPMRKWRALTTLTLGVILISNEALPRPGSSSSASGTTQLLQEQRLREFMIGMAASFGDVLLSGFASIYFEMARRPSGLRWLIRLAIRL